MFYIGKNYKSESEFMDPSFVRDEQKWLVRVVDSLASGGIEQVDSNDCFLL